MKKYMVLFAVVTAMFISCAKSSLTVSDNHSGSSEFNVSISVSNPNSSDTDSKAYIKTGWSADDIISIWYDANTTEKPNLVIKYNGTSWNVDGTADIETATPSSSGYIKAVYNDKVVVAAKDSYTYDGATLSANIHTWTFLSELQIVLTGISSANASQYILSSSRLTPLADGAKFTVGTDGITVSAGAKGDPVTGIANGDGVAFVFAASDSYDSATDYDFCLIDKTDFPSVSLKNFTALSKTLSHTSNRIKGLKIAESSFSTTLSATDLSATASANTYIVSAKGKYCFDASLKGNGGYDPLTGKTATRTRGISGTKVLWELYSQGRAIHHDGTQYELFYAGGYVFFATPETFTVGDAYIAIHDSSNNILWSWLIWATPAPGTMEYNTKTFMDRNIGAIEVGNCMRGFLYEWGRKDAFSAANGGYDVYPYSPVASSVFSHIDGPVSIEYGIANPTVYVRRKNDSDPSWMNEAGYTSKPWRDDVKTIYDPCPIGWRVPLKGDLSNYGSFPATGLTTGYDPGESYKGFVNPGSGYCWYSTTNSEEHKQKAYAFVNDSRKGTPQFWGQDQGYAIRPISE